MNLETLSVNQHQLLYNRLSHNNPLLKYDKDFPFKKPPLPNGLRSVSFFPCASVDDVESMYTSFLQNGCADPSLFKNTHLPFSVHKGMVELSQKLNQLPCGRKLIMIKPQLPCSGLTTAIYYAMSELSDTACIVMTAPSTNLFDFLTNDFKYLRNYQKIVVFFENICNQNFLLLTQILGNFYAEITVIVEVN
ncbi:hypothetical protein P9112_010353 [Eukaryota sp. TZLM1-RC]